MYVQDICYNTSHLTLGQKREICIEAKKVCFEWWVDKLDCSKSVARQNIEMSFEDILKKLTDDCHFVFIYRRGYENWKNNKYFKHTWSIEIGFCTMGKGVDYFLFIYMKEEEKDIFINKYVLEQRK